MKMGIKYTALFRLIPALLFIAFFYFRFYQAIEIEAEHNCKKIEQTQDYCVFNCSFSLDREVKGRIIVTQTVWASVFEEDFKGNEYSTLIKLPRRNYAYWLRVGFYSMKGKKLYEYGMLEDWLKC
jgi:hypothetical protein